MLSASSFFAFTSPALLYETMEIKTKVNRKAFNSLKRGGKEYVVKLQIAIGIDIPFIFTQRAKWVNLINSITTKPYFRCKEWQFSNLQMKILWFQQSNSNYINIQVAPKSLYIGASIHMRRMESIEDA